MPLVLRRLELFFARPVFNIVNEKRSSHVNRCQISFRRNGRCIKGSMGADGRPMRGRNSFRSILISQDVWNSPSMAAIGKDFDTQLLVGR